MLQTFSTNIANLPCCHSNDNVTLIITLVKHTCPARPPYSPYCVWPLFTKDFEVVSVADNVALLEICIISESSDGTAFIRCSIGVYSVYIVPFCRHFLPLTDNPPIQLIQDNVWQQRRDDTALWCALFREVFSGTPFKFPFLSLADLCVTFSVTNVSHFYPHRHSEPATYFCHRGYGPRRCAGGAAG